MTSPEESNVLNRDEQKLSHPYSTTELTKRFLEYRQNSTHHIFSPYELPFSSPETKPIIEKITAQLNAHPTFYIDSPQTFDAFKKTYHIDSSEVPVLELFKIFENFRKLVKRINSYLYWRFSFKEAKDLLVKHYPQYSELCEKLINKTTFLKYHGGQEDETEIISYGASPMGSGDIYGINVPELKSYEIINSKQMERILTLAHELLHIINFYYMKQEFGYPDKFDSIDTKHSILFTIQEGLSLALEYLLLKELTQMSDDIDDEQIANLKKFSINRLKSLREHCKYEKLSGRTKITEYYNEETDYYRRIEEVTDISEIRELDYVEGMHLALILKRNGWSLDDIPELWATIRSIFDRLILEKKVTLPYGANNENPHEYIYNALVKEGQSSLWPNLKSELRRAKPKRTQDNTI